MSGAPRALVSRRSLVLAAPAFGLLTLGDQGCAFRRDVRSGAGDSEPKGNRPEPESSQAADRAPAGVPPVTFPLGLSQGRRYLVDRGGRPFLIHGEAAWSLIAALDRRDVERYIEDRRQRGFNLVIVNLLEHQFVKCAPKNYFGDAPFATFGNFTKPNAAYFDHAEWVLRRARDKGLVVMLCPAYLGYEGGKEGWYQEILEAGPRAMRSYGEFVAERFAKLDNILWLCGGDYTPPPQHLELVNAMAEGIKSKLPESLLSAHFSPETSSAEVSVGGWIDLDTTYTYGPVYVKSLADTRRHNGRPHFLIESTYELERDSTPQSLRAQAYYALLTGAVGQVFGNGDIWRFAPHWVASLNSPGTSSMQHLRSFFAEVPWTELVVDLQGEILVSGQGTYGSSDYAVLARAADRSWAVAYLPSSRRIGVDAAKLSLPIEVRWYDPASGSYVSASVREIHNPGVTQLEPPQKAPSSDWVLLLKRG